MGKYKKTDGHKKGVFRIISKASLKRRGFGPPFCTSWLSYSLVFGCRTTAIWRNSAKNALRRVDSLAPTCQFSNLEWCVFCCVLISLFLNTPFQNKSKMPCNLKNGSFRIGSLQSRIRPALLCWMKQPRRKNCPKWSGTLNLRRMLPGSLPPTPKWLSLLNWRFSLQFWSFAIRTDLHRAPKLRWRTTTNPSWTQFWRISDLISICALYAVIYILCLPWSAADLAAHWYRRWWVHSPWFRLTERSHYRRGQWKIGGFLGKSLSFLLFRHYYHSFTLLISRQSRQRHFLEMEVELNPLDHPDSKVKLDVSTQVRHRCFLLPSQ